METYKSEWLCLFCYVMMMGRKEGWLACNQLVQFNHIHCCDQKGAWLYNIHVNPWLFYYRQLGPVWFRLPRAVYHHNSSLNTNSDERTKTDRQRSGVPFSCEKLDMCFAVWRCVSNIADMQAHKAASSDMLWACSSDIFNARHRRMTNTNAESSGGRKHQQQQAVATVSDHDTILN